MVLGGHGRLEPAKRLSLVTLPVRVAAGLTPKQQKAYVLTDNKIVQMSKWDGQTRRSEVELLTIDGFNIELTVATILPASKARPKITLSRWWTWLRSWTCAGRGYTQCGWSARSSAPVASITKISL